MYKEKVVAIQDGREITKEIEVFRCLDIWLVFREGDNRHLIPGRE